MKELKHINMLIFKRNTGDVAVQLLVVVVVLNVRHFLGNFEIKSCWAICAFSLGTLSILV